MKALEIREARLSDGRVWAQCEIARTFAQRLRGLLGRTGLDTGKAMRIEQCNAVHTVGMRFPLDLVFVSCNGMITRIVRGVPPGRLMVYGGARTTAVYEAETGKLDFSGLTVGSVIQL